MLYWQVVLLCHPASNSSLIRNWVIGLFIYQQLTECLTTNQKHLVLLISLNFPQRIVSTITPLDVFINQLFLNHLFMYDCLIPYKLEEHIHKNLFLMSKLFMYFLDELSILLYSDFLLASSFPLMFRCAGCALLPPFSPTPLSKGNVYNSL